VTDRAPLDFAWDGFVESTPGATIVQTTVWAEAKRRIGIDCVRVRVMHTDGGPAAGAVLRVQSVAPGVKVGYVPHGPIVDPLHPSAAEPVLEGLELAARQLHLLALVIQPGRNALCLGNPANSREDGRPTWLEVVLRERGYDPAPITVAPEATVELDLTLPYQRLAKGLSSSRRHAKKDAHPAVSFVEVQTDDDLETFHCLHELSSDRQGFTGISLQYLRGQWDVLHPPGRDRLFFACYEGEAVCGVLGTAFADTFTSRLIGWTGEHRDLRLPERLDWFIVRAMQDEGFARYDGGGVDPWFLAALDEGRAAAIRYPGPYQLVVNPVLRTVARRLAPMMAGNPRLTALANRWKSG